jgi:hypothetical protein
VAARIRKRDFKIYPRRLAGRAGAPGSVQYDYP